MPRPFSEGSNEPSPGPSGYSSTLNVSETAPLHPRFQEYNLGGRRRRDSKTVGIALLGLITIVGLFLGLVFGLTEAPRPPGQGLELSPGRDQPSSLMLLMSRQWPIKADYAGNHNLLAGVKPLSVTFDYLEKLQNTSLERLERLDRLEARLKSQRVELKPDSASYRHQQLFLKTCSRAIQKGRDGLVHCWAGARIKHDHNMTGSWYRRVTKLVPVHRPAVCSDPPPHCDPKLRYRTADGTCNNLRNPYWGSALSAFRRVLEPDYEDGVFAPRSASDGGYLPAARQVSRTIFTDEYHGHPKVSLMMMQWGQFVDHDITATAAGKASNGAAIRCCGADIDRDPTLLHPECMSMLVKYEDPVFASANVTCMDFVRSAPAPLCNYGPRQQMNQITSFIDGSTIYGSSDEDMKSLRSFKQGKLRTQQTEDGRELLAISPDPDDGCNRNKSMKVNQYCFKSGDARVNEQISLTVTHTQWVRQHNQIAWELADMNPHWNDEKIFQESRRIVIAMMQHITANEYLPLLLGWELSKSVGLLPGKKGYSTCYSKTTDPTISNVFATAAFRFGHSQIQGLIKMMGPAGKTENYVQLHRLFFNPTRLYEPTKMDALTRGQLTDSSRSTDTHFTTQVTNHLFEGENDPVGLDLGGINVQRGRDHGLPPYNAWRRRCGLPSIGNYTHLRSIALQPSMVDQVETQYRSVEHIDLYVGGLLEKPLDGAVVGPTFACLLTDQFLRLKTGDRFWYETGDADVRFTQDQLRSLRRANLARVLCDTSDDIRKVQRRPLLLPSSGNELKPCGSRALPAVDLSPWMEDSGKKRG